MVRAIYAAIIVLYLLAAVILIVGALTYGF